MANNSFRNRIIDDPKIQLHASDPLPEQRGREHGHWVILQPAQPPCLHMRCSNCGGTGKQAQRLRALHPHDFLPMPILHTDDVMRRGKNKL